MNILKNKKKKCYIDDIIAVGGQGHWNPFEGNMNFWSILV